MEIKSSTSRTEMDTETLNRLQPEFPGAEAYCFSRDS